MQTSAAPIKSMHISGSILFISLLFSLDSSSRDIEAWNIPRNFKGGRWALALHPDLAGSDGRAKGTLACSFSFSFCLRKDLASLNVATTSLVTLTSPAKSNTFVIITFSVGLCVCLGFSSSSALTNNLLELISSISSLFITCGYGGNFNFVPTLLRKLTHNSSSFPLHLLTRCLLPDLQPYLPLPLLLMQWFSTFLMP
uniref:Uncharacterized protein n=1 Tax=Myotis myotis TaxID=51298 RepID=A0A7J7Y0T4_MYOMY|nr:hypothetical protein mMyoMyo1_011380 [Myotis myotis]